MFNLGAGELIVILVIVLVIFGGGRLADLGTQLGEGIKNFKKGYRDSKSIDVTPSAGKLNGGETAADTAATKDTVKRES